MVNYEDLTDSALNQTKLPTWQNDPAFTAAVKAASVISIEGNEPWFYEHHGQQLTDEKAVSRGYFYIGVQSYKNMSYSIEVATQVR